MSNGQIDAKIRQRGRCACTPLSISNEMCLYNNSMQGSGLSDLIGLEYHVWNKIMNNVTHSVSVREHHTQ